MSCQPATGFEPKVIDPTVLVNTSNFQVIAGINSLYKIGFQCFYPSKQEKSTLSYISRAAVLKLAPVPLLPPPPNTPTHADLSGFNQLWTLLGQGHKLQNQNYRFSLFSFIVDT